MAKGLQICFRPVVLRTGKAAGKISSWKLLLRQSAEAKPGNWLSFACAARYHGFSTAGTRRCAVFHTIPRHSVTPLVLMTQQQQARLFSDCSTFAERICSVPSSEIGRQKNSTLQKEETEQFCSLYQGLDTDEKRKLIRSISELYGVDQSLLENSAQNFIHETSKGSASLKSIEKLSSSSKPRYLTLFTNVGQVEKAGVKFLVDFRADILATLKDSVVSNQSTDHLRAMDNCLKELLSIYFSTGLLKLERITWESPCDILQMIAQWERVHPVRTWTDIRQRVGRYRRCFVFFHPTMPRIALMVLHVALTDGISSSIKGIVRQNRETDELDEDTQQLANLNTAIFYSISATQPGLKGIDLGNQLIKKVVAEIRKELPQINTFSTLSPIPGFRDWLITEINMCARENRDLLVDHEISTLTEPFEKVGFSSPVEGLRTAVADPNTYLMLEENAHLASLLQPVLMRFCARYLYAEKHRNSALDAVAHFHLQNGAMIWRINWMADTSPRGLKQSLGLMANYRYFLDRTAEYSLQYQQEHKIAISGELIRVYDQFATEFKSML